MEGRERKFSLSSQPEPFHTSHSSFSTPMQQHQSHEMVALKRAYADVILNTMKESAGRVMVSEKRALMLQQELTATKENALHMLMRLKKMMDAKTAEAEKASLQQQRKIEELEAQLNEAEDVVTDLRAELKHVYFVLEKIRNNQVQPLNGQNIKQVATCVSVKPEISISYPHKELECITSCDVVNKSLTMNILDKKQLHISNLEDCSGHDSDFASVITRSKEPELCRNGFTQRIRALEGNLLDEKLLMQDVHNQRYGKKLGVIAKDVDGKVAKFRALNEEMKFSKHVKLLKIPKWKIFSGYRSQFLSCKFRFNDSSKLSKDVCSLPSINLSAIIRWKRKRRRHRHLGIKSSAFRSCKPSFVLEQCSSVCDNAKCCEDEKDANMNSVVLLTDAEPVHGATELVEKAIEKDNKLSNTGDSAEQNLTGPSSDMKVEVVVHVSSTNSDMKDEEAFIEKDRSCSQVDESKLLKYTFQRKRKKEVLGNTHQNFDSKKSTVKRRVEDKQNGAWEPQNLA
ncbi:hypothetical protein VIGAN_11029000 [Vigna angularis var. angularis]|uniref:Uncharacterized protein n=1 Tax=Vigna angularis var. angularis TaxID=157739 RepID=A0A0S3T795_PHAAN|nr:uncharacterized protein LOC108320300 isoform X2 [Vigna angularis]BAU01128.1 hypothetical protein VIGAN_11029000 [Vigna angularis var. angularis]